MVEIKKFVDFLSVETCPNLVPILLRLDNFVVLDSKLRAFILNNNIYLPFALMLSNHLTLTHADSTFWCLRLINILTLKVFNA